MKKAIRHVIIPAAGLGTRFLPTTKSTPKELIPLVDRPCIDHVVDEAIEAGAETIIFVISSAKKMIESYYRKNNFLNSWLKERNQNDWFQTIEKIESKANYHFVYQENPLGLGHAILCARDLIDHDHFGVILPDDIIAHDVGALTQMTKTFEEHQQPMLSVMPVKWEDVSRYGIVQANPITESLGDITDIVEKPKRELAPSNLAVIGRYILPHSIFSILESTKPGAGGEIQLTDALKESIKNSSLQSFQFEGERLDTGTPMGWLEANVVMALRDPRYSECMQNVLKNQGTNW